MKFTLANLIIILFAFSATESVAVNLFGYSKITYVHYRIEETRLSENLSDFEIRVDHDPVIMIDGKLSRPGGSKLVDKTLFMNEYRYSDDAMLVASIFPANVQGIESMQVEAFEIYEKENDGSALGESASLFSQQLLHKSDDQIQLEAKIYPINLSTNARQLRVSGKICKVQNVCEEFLIESSIFGYEESERKFLLFDQ